MPTNPPVDGKKCEEPAAAVLPPLPPGVVPGALIDVRAQRWLLSAVAEHADCRELHVVGLKRGDSAVFLWPFDRAAASAQGARLRRVDLRTWRRQLLRWRQAPAHPWTPRCPSAAHVLPYQLAPAFAAASGEARLILADEVGLGKTIQAGWIIADLLAREPDARVLLAAPAGLRSQWADELHRWFRLTPQPIDLRRMRRAVAALPADVSPFDAPGAYLVSLDFLKRREIALLAERTAWDLLVIDEAHTAAAPTDRHAALSAIAVKTRRIVCLTATPFSGEAGAFESLAALGASAASPQPLMFRRSREDTGNSSPRRHCFALIRLTSRERRVQRLLERYSREVWAEPAGAADGARLAVTVLRKRALSSPRALLRSLERRRQLLRDAVPAPRQLSLLADEETADEVDDGLLAARGLRDAAIEDLRLAELVAATAAAVDDDSKRRHLQRRLRRIGREPALVFTEYRDTLRDLAAAVPGSLLLHGGMSPAERDIAVRRFNDEGGVMLATDAAAEGLNLQRRCRLVVNYELPWNPARLEQRIGRVDRIGQRRRVHATSLVARDSAESLVLTNLARRLERVAAALGDRDRLAALLTDTRVAALVIGNARIDERIAAPSAPPVRLARAADRDNGAAQGHDRTAAIPAGWAPPIALSGISVSRLRPSSTIHEGTVYLVRIAVATPTGEVAGERVVAVMVAHTPSRRLAGVRAALEAHRPSVEDVARAAAADWIADVVASHADSVDAQIARERALAEPERDAVALQPGLFDNRALRGAQEQARYTAAERLARHDRLALLRRRRTVTASAAVTAILLACR